MSIAQVHLMGKDKYGLHDDVVVYFCFLTLGVAVSLRPGDFLLFNALIPHCILSQCKQGNNIYCVSMYLKSAIVGMNNNLLHLNTKQAILSKRYQKISKKHAFIQMRWHSMYLQIQFIDIKYTFFQHTYCFICIINVLLLFFVPIIHFMAILLLNSITLMHLL
jgi:hypothetical protein